MSVVIVGGNERMVFQYESICKELGHRAKVFAKEQGSWKKQMGCPDLVVLFTNTVSHKMVNNALAGSPGETKFRSEGSTAAAPRR